MEIPTSEFKFTFSRSSGAGGQNVNKVNSKVTLCWSINESKFLSFAIKKRFQQKYSHLILSNGTIQVVSQRFRTQPRNISDCIQKVFAMLEAVKDPPKRRIPTKPTKGSIQRRITSKKIKSDIKKNRKKVF